MKSIMVNIVLGGVGIYATMVVVIYGFQRSLLYFPTLSKASRISSRVPDMQEIVFTTEDGLQLFAWYRKTTVSGLPTVVIFHGNAGSLADRGDKARVFLDQGYGVMLVEYRGYGGNPGTPTESGLMADGRAALAALAGFGVGGRDVVLYGESLGSGVATAMALEARQNAAPVAALVLEAPFTSTVDVAMGRYPFLPVRWLMKDKYDSLSRMAEVKVPVLVVHGEKDHTVPVALGKKLFAAANQPKESVWVKDADHSDLYQYGVGARVLEFLARTTAKGPQPQGVVPGK